MIVRSHSKPHEDYANVGSEVSRQLFFLVDVKFDTKIWMKNFACKDDIVDMFKAL